MTTQLTASGVLSDRALITAFAETPRHVFARRAGGTAASAPVSSAYSDRVIPTRYVDTFDGALTVTSSLSQPTVVAIMLELLHLRGGENVLEIGTGLGYNAALLCHRLGDQNVTSVDIDPHLVDAARECLTEIDHHPTLAAVDGEAGYPARAPFDRILATCALDHVPRPWLGQLREDARVVLPLTYGGLLMVLRFSAGVLSGRARDEGVYFMRMRHSADEPGTPSSEPQGEYRHRTIDIDQYEVTSEEFTPWLELSLPDVRALSFGAEVRLGTETGHARITDDAHGTVVEEWGTPFFDEVVEAWHAWREAGRPRRDRFGLSVTETEQWAWVDEPDSDHRWPLTDDSPLLPAGTNLPSHR
ncbi:hypothetical protein STSO111631_16455 [Stackebrandtia soli]